MWYAGCRRGLQRPAILAALRSNPSQRHYQGGPGVFGFRQRQERVSTGEQSTARWTDQTTVHRIVQDFRSRGHILAQLDPLGLDRRSEQCAEARELRVQLDRLRLLSSPVDVDGLVHHDQRSMTGQELADYLNNRYAGQVAAEFAHISNTAEREWLTKKFETLVEKVLSEEQRKEIARDLIRSELMDQFIGRKFPTVKRYGGEGAETLMTAVGQLLDHGSKLGVDTSIIGIAHRGRLNLLSCLLKFPPVVIFRKMKGLSEFDISQAPGTIGDVLSHLFTSVDIDLNGRPMHVSLLPNPSHLEAINPSVVGKARARMQSRKIGFYADPSDSQDQRPGHEVLPLQIHGDAAFAGQGVIAETLAMANVPHYEAGGSVHLITNNQIGYTTPALRGRSSRYCSDTMKVIEAPIIHVNGGNPDLVAMTAQLAVEYRQKFGKDIGLDLVCYRRWGHNEMDDPSFTNPEMYTTIGSRKETTPFGYARQVLTDQEIQDTSKSWLEFLEQEFNKIESYQPENQCLKGQWSGLGRSDHNSITTWNTGFDTEALRYIGAKSLEVAGPKIEGFKMHPTIQRVKKARMEKITSGKAIDWPTAEILAFGSLLYQGFNIRISGQDVGRGTFSQRHGMLVCQESERLCIPLNGLLPNQQGHLELANSILSEEAVLAYEYGFSLESPKNLVIWEAQFGDFFNGAQIGLDTLLSGGEWKWMLQSSMTLLLPHGMDGAGPEHSSSHIERFLQMCDSKEDVIDSDAVNWQIANPTLPAQHFHLLRRQMIRNYRKPLVVASPKILLRHPECVSDLNDFGPGQHFHPVLDDSSGTSKAKKLIFCSGKHFFALNKYRTEKNITDTAIIRIEQLCPFPAANLIEVLKKYPNAKELIWSQEEHRNQGAWTFVDARFQNVLNRKLRYVGRDVLGAPAVGIGSIHKQEAEYVIQAPFS